MTNDDGGELGGEAAGRFSYRITAPKKNSGIPFHARVHIVPKFYSSGGKDGWPLLSPELMSEQEIDWHVQAYKKDLDRVGRLAKRALQRANERTRKWNTATIAAREASKGSEGGES